MCLCVVMMKSNSRIKDLITGGAPEKVFIFIAEGEIKCLIKKRVVRLVDK